MLAHLSGMFFKAYSLKLMHKKDILHWYLQEEKHQMVNSLPKNVKKNLVKHLNIKQINEISLIKSVPC